MITLSGVRSSCDIVAIHSSLRLLAVRRSLTRLAISKAAAACNAIPLRMRQVLGDAGVGTRRATSTRCCGQFQQGVHYRSETDENVSQLGLSILRAMGVARDSFGMDEGLAQQPLSGVEVA